MNKEIRVFAPATIANVTCGFDILGFPLDGIGDEIIVRPMNEPGVKITAIHGAEGLPLDPHKNVSGKVALEMLKEAQSEMGIEMELIKGIHPGSGMGSSASSSAGAAFAVNELLGHPFSEKDLVRFAMEGERVASGTPHADNVAPSVMGGFTLVRSYDPLDLIKLSTPGDLWCTVIHPQLQLKTELSRNLLRKQIPLKTAVQQWGNVAGLVAGLFKEDYDLIGRSLIDVVAEPTRSILIPGFKELKEAALQAGGLGGGIAGSGPSVYILSKGEETARKVESAFKEVYTPTGIPFNIYVSRLASTGARIIE